MTTKTGVLVCFFMSYPLIILGAGASYDYAQPDSMTSQEIDWRPPVTNEIFNRRFFSILDKHPQAKDIATTILTELKHGSDFESVLSSIKARTEVNDTRRNQLVDLSFYLQSLFAEISRICHGNPGSNFRALLQSIRDKYRQAIIVSFNYDNLLEDAFGGEITERLDSYISGPIKVFKVHGGCDWNYLQRRESIFVGGEVQGIDDRSFFVAHPDVFEELLRSRENKETHVSHIVRSKTNPTDVLYYPALALPLNDKERFLCPDAHVEILDSELSKVDKVLIIGWRGRDKSLLSILQKKLQVKIGLTVVSGSKEGVDNVFGEFDRWIKTSRAAECAKGFSHFMGSTECKTFFGTA